MIPWSRSWTHPVSCLIYSKTANPPSCSFIPRLRKRAYGCYPSCCSISIDCFEYTQKGSCHTTYPSPSVLLKKIHRSCKKLFVSTCRKWCKFLSMGEGLRQGMDIRGAVVAGMARWLLRKAAGKRSAFSIWEARRISRLARRASIYKRVRLRVRFRMRLLRPIYKQVHRPLRLRISQVARVMMVVGISILATRMNPDCLRCQRLILLKIWSLQFPPSAWPHKLDLNRPRKQ
mmetsp:Transcript_8291/g.14756  ORF Transcript_8291/g.14756 Transcript_8291/m.14756 type:complete len:231 (+) Transcript_8291:964-1656(+)